MNGSQPDQNIKPLARELVALGYTDLFQRSDDAALVNIRSRPDARKNLTGVVLADDVPMLARFLAAEILFAKLPDYPPQNHKKALAAIYAAALDQGFAHGANSWWFPPGRFGLPGMHLVALGRSVLPALQRLLRDDRAASYEGSRDATYGNSLKPRMKDLAAVLAAKIVGVAFDFSASRTERDGQIERLAELLNRSDSSDDQPDHK
jgi:hypothetical protein